MAIGAGNKVDVEGALEGFVLVADGVHAGDLRADVARLIEIPGLKLIFFAMVVFLLAGVRLMVEQFVGGTIEADVGRERGCKHVAANEGGSITCLQVSVENVWCIWPEVWPEVFLRLALGELFDILLELSSSVAPCEVGVAMGEAAFGEEVFTLRTGEGFGQENDLRMLGFDVKDTPAPKLHRFGMGIVDAEDFDALLDPIFEDGFELIPEIFPVVGFEVDW